MHNDARRRKRMKVAARCLGCACQRFVYPAATVGGEDLMDRGHEFIVDLPGEGTYIVKLLEGVRIEQSGGSAVSPQHTGFPGQGPSTPAPRGR
jgi:hypothetical protein